MITHKIDDDKSIHLFQNDQLVFLRDNDDKRLFFNHDEMNEICKIWAEFKGRK